MHREYLGVMTKSCCMALAFLGDVGSTALGFGLGLGVACVRA